MYSSNMQQQLNQIFGLMGGFFDFCAWCFAEFFPIWAIWFYPKIRFFFSVFFFLYFVGHYVRGLGIE